MIRACTTGAYQIRNLVNNKVYVGGAYKSFYQRERLHWRDLRQGIHGCKHLQAAWNKYGEENFVFEILQGSPPIRERIIACEQYWLDKKRAADRRFGYNTNPTAESRLGAKLSEKQVQEAKARMATVRFKIAEAKRKNPPSAEARERMGAANRGKKRKPTSMEVRQRLSEIRKAFWDDPVRSAAMRASKATKEAKAKNSKAIKKYYEQPGTKEKNVQAMKAVWAEPVKRAKMLEARRKRAERERLEKEQNYEDDVATS